VIWIGDVLLSQGEGGVYNERMLGGARVWDPHRSKMSALYHVGTGVELKTGMRVLYLGAANGTTVSHVADYVDVVYAVEFAPRPMQDLLEVSRRRRNVIPIMADAARPNSMPRWSKLSICSIRMWLSLNRQVLLFGIVRS